jgi:MFS family permease
MNFIRVFDNGIIPATTTTLKEQSGLSSLEVGSLGSLVYVGEVIGSMIAIPVYQKVPVKFVLLACIVCQSVMLLTFAFSSNNFRAMATARFFTGLFQVFISIFGPIWCDTHAPADRKTTWITYFIVATPAGMVAGYLLTALVQSFGGHWAYCFILQVVLLVPVSVFITTISPRFLEIN